MNPTKIILIAGFGNLGVKLLPLRWAFPYLRFLFVEKYWPGFENMRRAFRTAGTLGEFLQRDLGTTDDDNLKSFHAELKRLPGVTTKKMIDTEGELPLGELFEQSVHYCGERDYTKNRELLQVPADEFENCRKAHRELVRQLVEHERAEVLLYLAARPEDYLWYMERYAAFARRVAIDKPLAKDEASLRTLEDFARSNPELEIRPIDHYLFKLDFTSFIQALERRGGSLDPRSLRRLEIHIAETEKDEHRYYFAETGIIRDMMPHVEAMIAFLFRNFSDLGSDTGNVAPFVTAFDRLGKPGRDWQNVLIQAVVDQTIWTGEQFLPVRINIGKWADKNRKEIRVIWGTGQAQPIDLARKQEGEERPYVDWAGALKYLMDDSAMAKEMSSHFTFERACQITRDVFTCQAQAERKMAGADGAAPTSFRLTSPQAVAIPREARKVWVFNFDGVLINTEEAHTQAWRIWHEVLGLPFPDLALMPWYRPGKSNRLMVAEAAGLGQSDGTGFGVQDADALFRLFAHILREEKLKLLRTPTLMDYHRGVRAFLRKLRRQNQILVLESTNDARLVHESLELFFQQGPDEDPLPLGFDRHYVGRRNGLRTYAEIITDFQKQHDLVIFDDFLDVLKDLRKEFPALCSGTDRRVRLVHMHTMSQSARDCTPICEFEGYTSFDALPSDLA